MGSTSESVVGGRESWVVAAAAVPAKGAELWQRGWGGGDKSETFRRVTILYAK